MTVGTSNDLLAFYGQAPPTGGPTIRARVVGIGDSTMDQVFLANEPGFFPSGALLERYGTVIRSRGDGGEKVPAGRIAMTTNLVVRLRPGTDLAKFHRDVARVLRVEDDTGALVPGRDVPVRDLVEDDKRIEHATDLERVGLLLFALVAALASLVLVGQAIARAVYAMAEAAPTVRALGMVRWEIVRSLLIPYGPVAVLGALVSVGFAVALSPLFPVGLAGRIDPDKGVHLDGVVLLTGGVVVAIAVLLAAGFAAWRASAPQRRELRHRTSAVARAARAVLPLPVGLGAGLAVDRGPRPALAADPARRSSARSPRSPGSSAASGCSTASTTRWRRRRGRGRCGTRPRSPTVSSSSTSSAPSCATDHAAAAVRDPGTRTDDRRGRGHPRVRGHAAHRPPPVPRDLGPRAARHGRGRARARHRAGAAPRRRTDGCGSAAATSPPVTMTVTGKVAPAPGRALVVRPGRARDARRAHPDHRAAAAGALRAGGHERRRRTTAATRPRRSRTCTDARGAEVDGVTMPQDVLNLRNVRPLPRALSVFLVLLGVAALGHALVTAVRRRRGELAVLRAMGFTPRQTAATILAQAATVARRRPRHRHPARHRARPPRRGSGSPTRPRSCSPRRSRSR